MSSSVNQPRGGRGPTRAGLVVATLLAMASSPTEAGISLGFSTKADNALANVQAVLKSYNAASGTSLTSNIDVFKRTDTHANYVFHPDRGFHFYSDSAGTFAITTNDDFVKLSTAYFSYTGAETLLYYTVKGSTGFQTFQFQSGLNLLTVNGTDTIARASFFDAAVTAVPEPNTAILALLGVVAVGGKAGLDRIRRGARPAPAL